MSLLSLNNLSKRFGQAEVVRDINVDIRSGEFFSILGPSGCGKTTMLRMIAGFESPATGKILLDGRDITGLSAQRRGIGMVFQNYALFPHMTVYENVAFGLDIAKVGKQEMRARVMKILDSVHLGHKANVPVPNLSGGEQQRVAVARALVVEPSVLLFDEPLSNLDVSLRGKTRMEIRSLQRKTGITTIYVTHDQSEAMGLSDRIAVMREGRIEQVGTPTQIYEHPASPFVAQFVGGANLIDAVYKGANRVLTIGDVSAEMPVSMREIPEGNIIVAIKPETISISSGETGNWFEAVVETKEYGGFVTNIVLSAWGMNLHCTLGSSYATDHIEPGMRIGFTVDWSRCNMFPRGE